MTDSVPADNHDNAANTTTPASELPAPTGETTTFTPERTHIFALGLMAMVCIIMAGWNPLLLGWTVIIPAVWIYWVVRAKTVVAEQGIAIRYAFRPSVTITWDEFEGIGFKGSKTFAATKKGDKRTMPGVTFNSLPALYDASRGRIPDALSQGKIAADEKVVVVHRDGQQILMSKEEFAQYEAAKQSTDVTGPSTTGSKGASTSEAAESEVATRNVSTSETNNSPNSISREEN